MLPDPHGFGSQPARRPVPPDWRDPQDPLLAPVRYRSRRGHAALIGAAIR